jgi:hypothetical protein
VRAVGEEPIGIALAEADLPGRMDCTALAHLDLEDRQAFSVRKVVAKNVQYEMDDCE